MQELISKVNDGYRIPGLVDAHVHIESSHLRPRAFGDMLVSSGTFAAVCDPHEIVNVAGERGLAFMIDDAKASPARLHFALPSCVPATPFETSGARIGADETARLFERYPELVALGEMMNYPGVLADDAETMGKIRAARARGKRVDGHFPGGRGEALRRYARAGITSDHESLDAEEALEKASAGMLVMIREGSSARNLARVLPAVRDDNWQHFCFCTDDMTAGDLMRGGGILDCVRKAVRLGLDPERAVAMASVIPARHYGITLDDDAYVVVRDLKDFEIVRVVPPKFDRDASPIVDDAALRRSVILPSLDAFAFPREAMEVGRLAIGVRPADLITEKVVLSPADAPLRLAVIERHGINGNIACAPLITAERSETAEGRAGSLHGAIASTIGHDSHNVTVVGDSDEDMRVAVARLAQIGGGATVVREGVVLADLRLPIGGLMSDAGAEAVATSDNALRTAAHTIGCTLPEPLTTLAFLSLPVIPHLKLTDCGLFDVDRWQLISRVARRRRRGEFKV